MKLTVSTVIIISAFMWPAGHSFAASAKNKPASNKLEIPDDPSSALGAAETLFKDGEYAPAKQICDKILERGTSLDSTQNQRLLLLMSRLSFANGRYVEAKPLLEKLLALNSKFELDPLSDPPEAIALLKEIRQHQQKSDTAPPKSEAKSESPPTEVNHEASLLRKRAAFWVGILPFGIGHFEIGDYRGGLGYLLADSTSFYIAPFFRGKESWSPPATFHNSNSHLPNRASEIFFMGSWGYEIMDVMPALLARDNFRANWARYWLSFMPLGVGQYKNGHHAKALGFGVVQSGLMMYAMIGRNDAQRKTASSALIATALYGSFDGWLHHKWISDDPKTVFHDINWKFMPSFSLQSNLAPLPTVIIEKQF